MEQAILRFAKALAPRYWLSVPEEEQKVWESTVCAFKGDQLLPELLRYLQKPGVANIDDPRVRYLNFRAGTLELRERAYAGAIYVYSLDAELRFGRVRPASWIKPDLSKSWVNGVLPILENGYNKATGRNLFLYERDVDALEAELLKASKSDNPKRRRNLKRAEDILRSSHEDRMPWPALKELTAIVQATPECSGVSRDDVDRLRKEIDQDAVRKKGRPRKSRNE